MTGVRAGAGLRAGLVSGLREVRLMRCSTYLGLGWRYLAPGHPTSICDIGINCIIISVMSEWIPFTK